MGRRQRLQPRGECRRRQWDWQINPTTGVVGRPVDFHVTAKDVNHGFALYGPDLRIAAQVQPIPGFDNVLRHTFTQPGTYRVMCPRVLRPDTSRHGQRRANARGFRTSLQTIAAGRPPKTDAAARAAEVTAIAVFAVVLLLMTVFGLTMRATQAQYLDVDPR